MIFPKILERKIFFSIVACLSTFLLSGCNHSFIFDDEGDCDLHYKLVFKYDMNLKWADAFANEVKSVRVYVFDERNDLVKIYQEEGDKLAVPGFAIDLDLPEGDYRLIAWCGIDNPGVTEQSFYAPENIGLEMEDLYCRLHTLSNSSYQNYSDEHLQFMFYGSVEVNIQERDDMGGIRYVTMPLIKDTNHIRVTLVQLSGEDTDVNDFTYSIEAANGTLNYENQLSGSEMITYLPWNLDNAETMIQNAQGDNIKCLSALADLDISRITLAETESMKLTIRNNSTHEIVASIPIIDYALLTKDYYETAYGHKMTDQEFLDREDEYNFTFFLDSNLEWISSFIYINSWRVVLHNYGI